jgi:hypothetical protein
VPERARRDAERNRRRRGAVALNIAIVIPAKAGFQLFGFA